MEPREYHTMARLEDRYWWYAGLRGLVCGAIRAAFGDWRAVHVLDAGCGTGGGMAALASTFPGAWIVGTDVSQVALRYAACRPPGRVIQGSVNRLPFRDGAFDVVVSTDVLDVAGVDARGTLGEMSRVLRPGGRLVVNVPACEGLRGAHDAAVHRQHRYRRDELEARLEESGFLVERVMYWNAVLFPAMLLVRRVVRPATGRLATRSDLIALPRMVNWLLTRLLAVDTWLCARVRMPFGASVFGVARKPRGADGALTVETAVAIVGR